MEDESENLNRTTGKGVEIKVEMTEARERSRSRGRDNDDKPRRRKRRVGWDDPKDRVDDAVAEHDQYLLAQQQQLLALQQQMGNKKARELYVGNLASGQVSPMNMREHFDQLFMQIPEYVQKYESLRGSGPIREIKLSSCGMYAFLEFWTEEITITAIEMDKHEFFGRSMRIGRPSGFVYTNPNPPPPMDVTLLRQRGLIPAMIAGMVSGDKKERQVYLGNLPPGVLTTDLIRELFEPACRLLPDFAPLADSVPSPVLSVDFGAEGRFAFVEFVNDRIATCSLNIFNNVEVFGKKLSVMRPQGYIGPGRSEF
jgi:hypothetical protein